MLNLRTVTAQLVNATQHHVQWWTFLPCAAESSLSDTKQNQLLGIAGLFGLCPLSGILKKNMTFQRLDLFPKRCVL
jgi:hypothetical protein